MALRDEFERGASELGDDNVGEGSGFSTIASGLGFVEGPVALPSGDVVVASITEGALFRIDPNGGDATNNVVERIDTGGGPNGLAVDGEGTLYVAQNGGIWGGKPGCPASVQRVVGTTVETIVDGLGAPNDLCFGPDGRLYFTDPIGESKPPEPSTAEPGRLYSCRPDGTDLRLLLEGPRFINGLAFSPNDDVLYVVETSKPHRLLRYAFDNGELDTEGSEVARLEVGFPDGIAIDTDGNIWVGATFAHAVNVYSPDGRLVRSLHCGEGSLPTNLCFGVARRNELYVAASGTGEVLRATVDAQGLPLHPRS